MPGGVRVSETREMVLMDAAEYNAVTEALQHMSETIRRQHHELALLRLVVEKIRRSQRILRRGGAGRVTPGWSR